MIVVKYVLIMKVDIPAVVILALPLTETCVMVST